MDFWNIKNFKPFPSYWWTIAYEKQWTYISEFWFLLSDDVFRFEKKQQQLRAEIASRFKINTI